MESAAQPPDPTSAAAIWVLHCDGSAFPNPGNMAYGATLAAPDGTHHTLSVPAHARGCNNEAEARAMMAALRYAKSLGARAVRVHSDSRVVVDQVTGNGHAIARLEELFSELRALLATFDTATVKWLPGHRNLEADALARAAAGLPPRATVRPRK